jgi:hypothetical protein
LAETYNKRFINILAQSIGNDPLPKEVEKIHWIDFTRYQKDFHKPLSELLRTLENEREEAREHTIWLRAAQKWESHKKISSRLLKGDDYRDASLWIQATTKNPNIPQPTPLVVEYISKSKQAIDQELAQEARRQKKLRNALVLVTFFLLISIGLGLYAYKQRLQLEDVFSKLEKEKALSDEKSQRLEDAMKSVTESSKNAELANYETLRLRLERDSALLRANSSDEQLAIKQQYAEQISRQKEISDREMQRQKNQSDKIQADLAKQKKALERIKENTVDLGDGYVYFEGLTKINRDNLWGYMDKQHTLVINPQYATATDFSNGVAHVSRNGKHAFINKQDQTISGWFDRLEPFIDGIAEVRRGNESAFINTKGEIISLWFNEMFDFHDDLAKVRIDDKWGYVNKQGVLVIKARFDYAFGFRKGKAKVRIGTTEFFIDTKGQTTTPDRSLQLYDN